MKRSISEILFLGLLIVLVAFSTQPAIAGGVHGGGGGGGSHGGGGWGYHGGYAGWRGGYWGGWRAGYWGYPPYCCGWGFGVSFSYGPYWGYGYPYAYGYAPYYYPYYSYYPSYYYVATGDTARDPSPAPSNQADNSVATQPDPRPPAPTASATNSNATSLRPIDAAYRSTPAASSTSGNLNAAQYSPASVESEFPAMRAEVKNVIRALRAMPPAARKRQINSGRYSNLTPEELALVREAAGVPSGSQ